MERKVEGSGELGLQSQLGDTEDGCRRKEPERVDFSQAVPEAVTTARDGRMFKVN